MGYVGQKALRRSFKNDVLVTTTDAIEPVEADVDGDVARYMCARECIREQAYLDRLEANDKMKCCYGKK
ncbi:hypothetical protein BG011_000660, partial [Mortierella polycephala]